MKHGFFSGHSETGLSNPFAQKVNLDPDAANSNRVMDNLPTQHFAAGRSPTRRFAARRFADEWLAAWRFAISAPAIYHCIIIDLWCVTSCILLLLLLLLTTFAQLFASFLNGM